MIPRLFMVNVDDTDHLTVGDERHGQESLVLIFRKRRKGFEARVLASMGIERNDGAVLCHPTRNTFSNLHSNISDLACMWQLRSTEDDFGMRRLEQIDETSIATSDVNYQPDQFIQHFLKRHVRT